MNIESYQPSSELASLVSDRIDGNLDEESNRRLQEILLADDVACQWYDRIMLLHSLLYLDGQHNTLQLPPSILSEIVPSSLKVSQPPASGASLDNTNAERPTPRSSVVVFGASLLREPYRLIAATALALLVAMSGAFYFAGGQQQVKNVANGPAEQSPYRGDVVAVVSTEVGCRFAYGVDGNTTPGSGDSFRAGSYQLVDGVLELEYDSGARIVVMSPAEFCLIDTMNLELTDGKISAEIPEAAVGFTIDTVGGSVVDLGTSFAVEARRGRNADVHVFEGEVRVEMLGAEGGQANPLQLLAGHASRIHPNSSIPSGIDLDVLSFIRRLGHTHNQYATEILQLSPAVYYQMEPVGDGLVLEDSSNSGSHAQIYTEASPGFPWTGGKIGSAFKLGGPAERTYAGAGEYPKAEGNQLSVVCWVYAESRPFWASIAKNWGYDDDARGQFHFGLLGDSGELAAHIVDASNMRDNAGNIIDLCVQDSAPIPLNQWHHVAMVADGQRLHLYRNGAEVDSVSYTKLFNNDNLPILAIGSKLNAEGVAAPDGWSMWDGRLDELAIFNQALDSQQIQRLYEISRDGS